MPRRLPVLVHADAMRWVQGAAMIAVLLLSACATTRVPPTLLPEDAQQQLLRDLPAFQMEGRAGVKHGDEDGFNASLDWRQSGEESSVRLSGPFGAGSLTVTWRPDLLRLAGSKGEVYENAEAEQVLLRELGFVPPFEALRYWVLGLEAPGEAPQSRTPSQTGRIGELVQQDWHIRYDRWTGVAAGGSGVQLPERLTVTREDLRLRVFVEKWKL